MHGLGPEAIERAILVRFNDVDPVSFGRRRPPTADVVPA
jgi:hypothetical protein